MDENEKEITKLKKERNLLVSAIIAVQNERFDDDEPSWSTLEYAMFNLANALEDTNQ